MTLSRSLIASLALHVLFGMGIVFAQYAGGLFKDNSDTIIVTLAGMEGSALTAGHATKRPRTAHSHFDRKLNPSSTHQRFSSDHPSNGGSFSRVTEARKDDPVDDGGSDVLHNSRLVGSQSGSASSEQWAIIVSHIEKVKTYPRMAREHGIQGEVRVRFKLKPSGDVESAEIVKSSGFAILDTASIRTVYRAAPMPYVSGWVEVPMSYVLK